MAYILITGGTGLVGTQLTKLLQKKAHNVSILSRQPKADNHYKWDVAKDYIDPAVFKDLDYIIHLAGAGIADKRWTDARKQVIINSRVETANLLFRHIKTHKVKLKGFISASGSNFYGAQTTTHVFKETDSVGTDFLGHVCKLWEDAAHQFKTLNIPVTILRTGIVLTKKGGALDKMILPIISPLGTTKQYMSWIHINDLCNLYANALDLGFNGVYNAVAPEHCTNYTFSKLLAKSVKRPFLPIAVPAFLLKLVFGELAVILLQGSRLSADKLLADGFVFTYPKLEDALKQL